MKIELNNPFKRFQFQNQTISIQFEVLDVSIRSNQFIFIKFLFRNHLFKCLDNFTFSNACALILIMRFFLTLHNNIVWI